VRWLAEHAPSRAFQFQARIASLAGRLRQAREFWIQSAELDGRNRLAEVAALTQLSLAETEASFGVVDAARQDVTAAMSAASSRDVDTQAARVLAMSGFPKDARLLLDRLLTEYPSSHTLARDLYVPAVRGALDLAQGNPQGAIDTLQSASPYDAVDFGVTYLRATAYLAANRPVEAATEFQKVIDRAHGRTAYEPLARLGVSRALARSGKSKESRAAYEEFFNAWKNADPELPILVAAREELAQLKQN
jgi:tetratricopeptide (TPR) repeat protein